LVLAVLATWRIAHLLVSEDGPAGVIAGLRRRLGSSSIGRLMDCFGCVSLWVALPLAFYVTVSPLDLLLSWLALSGAAFMLERVVPEPLVIRQVDEVNDGEMSDGMLRPKPIQPGPAGADAHRPASRR
jgi:hypothetical protein